jgi:hypothetical protein
MPTSRPERSAVEKPPHFARFLLAIFIFSALVLPLHAQIKESALSEKEVEEVRDARLVPSECILLFVKFLDLRTKEIQDLYAKPRHPGREEDTRELLQQFTSIADELSDNLDDYGPRHMDLRKGLPKIIEATERWSSALKSVPDGEAYEVNRKLALESIRDLRESATELAPQLAAWFKAHPPVKDEKDGRAPPIDIPR